MNISLPDSLKSFVDEQVAQRGYGTSSEYVRELIRKDADILRLRGMLLKGAASAPAAPAAFDGCALGLCDESALADEWRMNAPFFRAQRAVKRASPSSKQIVRFSVVS